MITTPGQVHQPTIIQSEFFVLDYQKATHQLEQAGSVVDRVEELITIIEQNHKQRQQRIWAIKTRMDQLAHKLNHLSIPPIRQRAVQPEPPAEIQDQLTQRKLNQYIRHRGEFLRRTAHDLRSNFSLVQGAASLFNRVQSDSDRAQMLDMLTRNLQQASQLLTQLLNIGRLEAGQDYPQTAVFDVARLLTQLVEGVRPLANEQGLWLQTEGIPALLVQGDATNVYRIAQNLLLNALTYTQKGGVTVRWEGPSTDSRWQLTITDTGPGLTNDTRKSSGEGIGLMVVRELCALLDGQLRVDSQAGTGTQFTLSFPQQHPLS